MSLSVYPEQMNCDYCHSLDDAALQRTIDSLLTRRLIRSIGSSTETRYSLTEAGGQMWEAERRPDWDRFVTMSQKELGNFQSGSVVAFCTKELIGRGFLGGMFASGLITPVSSIRKRQVYNKRLLPWKKFPTVFVLRCRTSDHVAHFPKNVDWETYESTRCWWRTIHESETLYESFSR